jgi:hypothetical protein
MTQRGPLGINPCKQKLNSTFKKAYNSVKESFFIKILGKHLCKFAAKKTLPLA